MNKFDSQQSQPKFDTDEGWLVQVYGNNRRLLCVLDPSHGWVFLLGCCVGLLVSVLWINAARYSPSVEPLPPAEAPNRQVD